MRSMQIQYDSGYSFKCAESYYDVQYVAWRWLFIWCYLSGFSDCRNPEGKSWQTVLKAWNGNRRLGFKYRCISIFSVVCNLRIGIETF